MWGLPPHVVDGGMDDHRLGVGINLLRAKKLKQGGGDTEEDDNIPKPLTFRASNPYFFP